MRHWFTTGCLTAVGVLMLVAASGTETPDQQRDTQIVPEWALTQDAPIVWPDGVAHVASTPDVSDCPHHFEIDLVTGYVAVRFDTQKAVTELYDRDYVNGWITRYDVAADLSYTTTAIPIDQATPRLAQDLDGDGDVEIVSQSEDNLLIYSSPDGALLAAFQWPGFNVVMQPAAVNLDDDPHLEIYVTPHDFYYGNVVIIDYDSAGDSFVKLADVPAPYCARGHPAVGDFDSDGRMEFISGNDLGYGLYEWQDPALVYIGQVGGPALGNDFYAATVRPKPGGMLHALLGHSSGSGLRRFELIVATGDNTFEIVHVFEDYPSAVGIHPCHGVDVDCDGLDELIVDFYPDYVSWHWDPTAADFVPGCTWSSATYGTFSHFHRVDLDQDGAGEWGTVSHLEQFRAFPDTGCVYCDTLGMCPFPSDPCPPGCQGPGTDPGSLTFDLYVGEEHEPQRVEILGSGCDEPWWATPASEWLQIDLAGGLSSGSLSVSVDFTELTAPDTLCDTLVIASRCPTWPQALVSVDLYLAPACLCACHSDPVCDRVTNVLDVVVAVDVAFRDGAPEPDPILRCPAARVDVNCDALTNVLDVVHLVNVAFRSGDPAVEFCDPCP